MHIMLGCKTSLSGRFPKNTLRLPRIPPQNSERQISSCQYCTPQHVTPVSVPLPSDSRYVYPDLDCGFPGADKVHDEPPVFVVHGFLDAEHCQVLINEGGQGSLEDVDYDESVLFEYKRLALLLPIVLIGTGMGAWTAHQGGLQPEDTEFWGAVARAFGMWCGMTGVLALLTKHGVQASIQKIFTGKKWSLATAPIAAAAVRDEFKRKTCELLNLTEDHLEVPTLTRYQHGQQQRVHVDARSTEFESMGGQRTVQCVVYLNTLDSAHGGATLFHDPALHGLKVLPVQGDALVFFTAFKDGSVDWRMSHSGEMVCHADKWIINTWATQYSIMNQPGSQML